MYVWIYIYKFMDLVMFTLNYFVLNITFTTTMDTNVIYKNIKYIFTYWNVAWFLSSCQYDNLTIMSPGYRVIPLTIDHWNTDIWFSILCSLWHGSSMIIYCGWVMIGMHGNLRNGSFMDAYIYVFLWTKHIFAIVSLTKHQCNFIFTPGAL
jgi:hypothetical protein